MSLNAYGYGTMPFWYGVVEDINDPEKLGRVRVRVFGHHSPNKQDIPTAHLPWAYTIQGTASAAISGIGQSITGLLQGSHVVGFFRDGKNAQEPIVMGSIGGVPQRKAFKEMGHNDPEEKYPLSKEGDHRGHGASLVLEPDTNRLARNEEIDKTVVKKKKDGVDKNVPNANGQGSWSEPPTPYAAKYPKNHVRYSETGHIEEWDDTPGKERLHKYHRTGTFEEIHPDGTRVTKIVGDDYEIIHKDSDLHIKGNCNITVDGNSTFFVKGNSDIEVNGNVTANIHKNLTATIDLNSTIHTKVNHVHTVDGTCSIHSNGNMSLSSGTHIGLNAPTIDLN